MRRFPQLADHVVQHAYRKWLGKDGLHTGEFGSLENLMNRRNLPKSFHLSHFSIREPCFTILPAPEGPATDY